MSGFGGPTDAEMRLAMAEWMRSCEWLEQELTEADRRSIRKVIGWRDATTVRYPGMSCEYEAGAVDITYETWDGEQRTFTWDGDFGYLVRVLTDVVNNY